jgi:hypothetical protein|nr:MAG TPA: Regulatory protein-modification, helix-turn-helix, transcriptional regulator, DNA [Caudoviricetes sp.]
MKVKGFQINIGELAELLHMSIDEYRHRLRNDRLTIGQILAVSKYVGFSLEETMDYFFADFDAKRFNLSRKIIREGKKNAKA